MLPGRAPDHLAGILADGPDAAIVVDGDDGRLLDDDALALDVDEDVGRAEINADIHAERAGLPFLDALDPGAEVQELPLDVLIPAPDVVRAADRRGPLGRERGRGSATRRRAGRRSRRRRRGAWPARGRRPAAGPSARSSAPIFGELAGPLEAVLEDRLVDLRVAVGLGQEHGRRAAGCRSRAPGTARSRCRPACRPPGPGLARVDLHAVRAAGRPRARPCPGPRRGRRMVLAVGALEDHVAAGDARRDRERAGLDAIGHDVVLGARGGGACPRPRSCPGTCARPRRPSSAGTR